MYWYPTILPYERHGSLFHIQTLEFWHPEETDLMLSLDLKRKNPTAAMRRFKKIKQTDKASKFLPEVSYRLIESFLLVGLFSEALSEKIYMRKKFPNSSWTVEAASLIDKSGLN